MKTEVIDSVTMIKRVYELPPKDAVVKAFEEDKGNEHLTTYKQFDEHPDAFELGEGKIACGQFIAFE